MRAQNGEDLRSQAETRQRILEAAGEVFAEKGFRAATTREICGKAGANVAAINYHFGDKEALYEEVLRFAHRDASERYPLSRETAETGAPEERLRTFIGWFLKRLLCEGRPAWQAKLLAREMVEPTRALDALVQSEFSPVIETLESVCRDLLEPGATSEEVRLAARSVLGQCLFYRHAQPVLARLTPEERFTADYVRRIAEHVAEFSLGGMEQTARKAAGAAALRKMAS